MAFVNDDKKNNNGDFNIVNNANVSIQFNTIVQMIKYSISNSKIITNSAYKRLDKFVNSIDEDLVYNETQQNQKNAFKILKEIVKIQIEDSIDNYSILTDHLFDKFKLSMDQAFLNEMLTLITRYFENSMKPLTENEIDRMNNYIKTRIAYIELYKQTNLFKDIYDNLVLDKMDPEELISNVSPDLTRVNKIVKSMSNYTKSSTNTFLNFLDSDEAVEVMEESVKKLRNPANKLKTGYVMHNKMLNGGFENGRVYTYFGIPKSFKSGTLLNMLMSTALSNKASDISNLDPNKKPVIYYLTMENSLDESLDRMYEFITGTSISDSEKSAKECLNEIITYTYNKTGISVVIEYKKNNEVSTDYLYEILEKLEDDGYQCIMMVQDYLKRIRSSDYIDDLRIRLGAISDEFTVFAKEKNIPLVTAAQLNRDAYRNVEKAISENKSDIAKQLDRSQIAESAMIIENIDYGIIINRENAADPEDPKAEDHLSFKLIASRGKQHQDRIEYFAQPFENSIRLVMDEGTGKVSGKSEIGSSLEGNKKKNSKPLDKLFKENAPNPFNSNNENNNETTGGQASLFTDF